MVLVILAPIKASRSSSSFTAKGRQLLLATIFTCVLGTTMITLHYTVRYPVSDDLLRSLSGQSWPDGQGPPKVVIHESRFTRTRNQSTSLRQRHLHHERKSVPDPPKFRLTDFTVAGINLGDHNLSIENGKNNDINDPKAPPFELYNDFDISSLIKGNEHWDDLIEHRRHLQRPTISFYGDKVAQKRWLQAMDIPTLKTFLIRYAAELTKDGDRKEEEEVIGNLIPSQANFVVKPTHRSGSSGVSVVKYDETTGKTTFGYGGADIEETYDKSMIVQNLVKDLHRPVTSDQSWALRHVKPGIIIEERFTNFAALGDNDGDKQPATEFKVFLVWGRVMFVDWGQGEHRRGLVHRNGTVVHGARASRESLPTWLDWHRVISLAEQLGAHKDMFRVDIFVGVPAGRQSVATKDEQLTAVQYVVSEQAFLPQAKYECGILEEGARLWLAGYRKGNFRVSANTEVPEAYKAKHMLTEGDAQSLRASGLNLNGQIQ